MRNKQVSRLLCLISILEHRPSGMTISEMKAALENRGFQACSRTIYRDVEGLAECGLPLFPEGSSDTNGQRWAYNHRLSMGKLLGGLESEHNTRVWDTLLARDAQQLIELANRLKSRAVEILKQPKQAS
jgi:predicted DNA-binding transcriptional regulator YafY